MGFMTPDNYAKDPVGFVYNQGSHILFTGIIGLTIIPAVLYFKTFGELPPKSWLFIFAGVIYFIIELIQGLKGWDTLEDWCFTVIYGNLPILYAATEKAPGELSVHFDIEKVLPFMCIALFHLFVGYCIRAVAKWRSENS